MVGGTAAVIMMFGKLHASLNAYDYSGSPRLAWSIALIGMLVVAAYGAGLPDLFTSLASASKATTVVLLAAGIAFSVVQLFLGDALLPRFVLGASTASLFPWYLACWGVARRGAAQSQRRDRVLLVGTDADLAALAVDLQRDAELPVRLVGHLTPGLATSVGFGMPLVAAVLEADATVVVLSREAQADDDVVHQAADVHARGIRIRTLSLFYEEWLGKLPLPELERASLLYDIGELHRAVYGRVSRTIDVAISAVSICLLSVVIPFVVAGNLVANRGPLFYRQTRVGKKGREFLILKFRTMRNSDTGLLNEWTAEDDPRITPFGRLLRRTHVDELPQLLNIIRGDLSLVGPRPEQPHYVTELTEKLPFYNLRHLVRPGLTGWAQVKYGYAGSERDALQKLQYEFYYLRHQSLGLDLKILLRTLRSVLAAEGR